MLLYIFVILFGCFHVNVSQSIKGLYTLSWSPIAVPSGINLDVCFSGNAKIADMQSSCGRTMLNSLVGNKYISYGGGDLDGKITASNLAELDTAVSAGKLSQWQGIYYDVEQGDAGLASNFAKSFANTKAHGLKVIVGISGTEPYAISDATALMSSFFTNTNIDYMSPMLYETGTETANIYEVIGGTPWSSWAKSKAPLLVSISCGATSQSLYNDAVSKLGQYGIKNITGYIFWGNSKPSSNAATKAA